MFDDFVGKTIEEASTNQEWLDYHEDFSKYLEFDSVASMCAKLNVVLSVAFCKELKSGDGTWELFIETILQTELDNTPHSCDLVLMAYCLIQNYRDTLTTEPFEFFDLVAENESLALISGSISLINMILFSEKEEGDKYLIQDKIEDANDALTILTKWWNINVLPK